MFECLMCVTLCMRMFESRECECDSQKLMVHNNLITNSFSFTYKICSQFMLIRPVYKRVCTHARPNMLSLTQQELLGAEIYFYFLKF